MKISASLPTNGRGLWSDRKKSVRIHTMNLGYLDDDGDFGELRVYFTKKTWDIHRDGLVYTDPKWLTEFRRYLRSIGFSRNASYDVDYSEQGMQGRNYVSLDVGRTFLTRWNTLNLESK